jgi:hypothetical protein
MSRSRQSIKSSIIFLVSFSLTLNLGYSKASAESQYEKIPVLKASDILPANIRQGKHHRVEEQVFSDGFTNRYKLNSEFFSKRVYYGDMLKIRVREIRAIVALKKMKKTDKFGEALVNSAKFPFHMAKDLILHPVDTISGIPKGMWRYMGRVGEMVTGERGESEDSFAKELIGFSAAKRKLAHQLGVDVYSTNSVLQEELNSVSWAVFSGGFTVSLAVYPLMPLKLVHSAYGMNKILRDYAPEDLRKLNRKKLSKIVFNETLIEKFLDHRYYSPRHETILVASLDGLTGARGRGRFVRMAMTAGSFTEAFFFQRVSQLMLEYHKNISPIQEIIVMDNLIYGLTKDKKLILPLLADHAVWTKSAANRASAITKAVKQKVPADIIEMWISGTLSFKAKLGLIELGWGVTDRAFSRFIK